MPAVVTTEEFRVWFDALDEQATDAVIVSIGVLERQGVALGHPRSSAIKGSRNALRELRVQAGGRPLRIFYAFDRKRQAVLLLGGDKTGQKRFYEREVNKADALFDEWLAHDERGR